MTLIQTAQVLRNLGVSSEGHGTGSNGNKQRSYAEVVSSTNSGQQEGNVDTHQKPSLMITIERKDRDWLRGCLVGEIKSITMLEGLKAEMENEGIRGYRLQPMGGKPSTDINHGSQFCGRVG
ncbi:hypothetical protein Ancab_036017 [Ancistrocladus abbreviatus]